MSNHDHKTGSSHFWPLMAKRAFSPMFLVDDLRSYSAFRNNPLTQQARRYKSMEGEAFRMLLFWVLFGIVLGNSLGREDDSVVRQRRTGLLAARTRSMILDTAKFQDSSLMRTRPKRNRSPKTSMSGMMPSSASSKGKSPGKQSKDMKRMSKKVKVIKRKRWNKGARWHPRPRPTPRPPSQSPQECVAFPGQPREDLGYCDLMLDEITLLGVLTNTSVAEIDSFLLNDGETVIPELRSFLSLVREADCDTFGEDDVFASEREILAALMLPIASVNGDFASRRAAANLEIYSDDTYDRRNLLVVCDECEAALVEVVIAFLDVPLGLIPGLGSVSQSFGRAVALKLIRNQALRNRLIAVIRDQSASNIVERVTDVIFSLFGDLSIKFFLDTFYEINLDWSEKTQLTLKVAAGLAAVFAKATGGPMGWASIFGEIEERGQIVSKVMAATEECQCPTSPPTALPTSTPTNQPSTAMPSESPTPRPTRSPTISPTRRPTFPPSPAPTANPTVTRQPTPSPTPRPTQPPQVDNRGRETGVFGDPHLSTFDRLRFDCQAAGEFTTVTSLQEPDFRIQERFTAVGSDACSQASVSTGVAIAEVGYPTIQVSIPRGADTTGAETIGGCPIDLFVGGERVTSAGEGAPEFVNLFVSGSNTVTIQYSLTGVRIQTTVRRSSAFGCFFLVQVFLPFRYRPDETVLGLLGTPNDNRSDDWRAPDGSLFSPPAAGRESIFSNSYNYCVENWCIRDEAESIFTYPRPEETFASISGCDENYDSEIEQAVDNAPDTLRGICGDDFFCLIDGICGGLADAVAVLEDEEMVARDQNIANPFTPTDSPSTPSAVPTTKTPTSDPITPTPTNFPTEQPTPRRFQPMSKGKGKGKGKWKGKGKGKRTKSTRGSSMGMMMM